MNYQLWWVDQDRGRVNYQSVSLTKTGLVGAIYQSWSNMDTIRPGTGWMREINLSGSERSGASDWGVSDWQK